LDLRVRKWWEAEEDCIMMLLDVSRVIKAKGMTRARHVSRIGEKCVRVWIDTSASAQGLVAGS
jgi:hypothetical protein